MADDFNTPYKGFDPFLTGGYLVEPNVHAVSPQVGSSGGSFSWGSPSTWFGGAADALSDLGTTVVSGWSDFNNAKLAIALEKERNKGILSSVKALPNQLKAGLPGVSSATTDADGYGASITDVIKSGAFLTGGSNVLILGAVAFAVWAVTK